VQAAEVDCVALVFSVDIRANSNVVQDSTSKPAISATQDVVPSLAIQSGSAKSRSEFHRPEAIRQNGSQSNDGSQTNRSRVYISGGGDKLQQSQAKNFAGPRLSSKSSEPESEDYERVAVKQDVLMAIRAQLRQFHGRVTCLTVVDNEVVCAVHAADRRVGHGVKRAPGKRTKAPSRDGNTDSITSTMSSTDDRTSDSSVASRHLGYGGIRKSGAGEPHDD